MPTEATDGPARPDAAVAALDAEPHRRRNALTGEWVLVSAGRTKRPWLGAEEPEPPEERPVHDPDCYLCPRNTRVTGDVNPDYATTFVFTNDFAALRPDTSGEAIGGGLFRAEGTRGTCRVVCFSPRHDVTLAGMDEPSIRHVIDVWADQTTELGERYRWVQVFENRGAAMGASNPHPHGQIWSGDALPVEAELEAAQQAHHYARRAAPARRLRGAGAGRPPRHPRPGRLADARPVLGGLAVRDDPAAAPASGPPGGHRRFRPRRPGGRPAGPQRPLRRAVPRPFPFSMGWHQAPFAGDWDHAVAGPRPLLPAAAAGHRAQVHGRLRAAQRAAARPHPGGGGRPPAGRSA